MPIDCKDWCRDKETIIHNLQENNSDGHNNEQIQFAVTYHQLCMIDCENRNHHSNSNGGGKRKKYVNKTKSVRYRTRRRVTPRIYRTHMNNRKKTARR